MLIGGLVESSFARAARFGAGWVASLLSRDMLVSGVSAVTKGGPGRDDPVRHR